jgi:hypothetical protein
MTRALLAILALACMAITSAPLACADNLLRVQQSPSPLEGTWRSGNFAFTFYGNGTYVYVGAMGNKFMNTRISEQGAYRISGDTLLVTRANGVVMTSQNYRRDLPVETTVYQWQLGTAQGRPALQLLFPTGGVQVFYKE